VSGVYTTGDGRHSYEVRHDRESLDRMEEKFDLLWQNGDILDTDEENPKLAKFLGEHDELEKEVYATDDPFAAMDDEEDWGDEASEEEKALKGDAISAKERQRLEVLKKDADAEKRRDALTIRQQIRRLEKDGLPKEDADALRKKYRTAIRMEETERGKPGREKAKPKRAG